MATTQVIMGGGVRATDDRPRPEARVRLRVTFADGFRYRTPGADVARGPAVHVAPCWNLSNPEHNGMVTRPEDGSPVEVLVYQSDVQKWKDMVEDRTAEWRISVDRYERELVQHIRSLVPEGSIAPVSEADRWSEAQRHAEAVFAGHPNTYFCEMVRGQRHPFIRPFASVEVVEANLPPPETDADKLHRAQSATIAKEIRAALGQGTGESQVARLEALIEKQAKDLAELRASLGDKPKK